MHPGQHLPGIGGQGGYAPQPPLPPMAPGYEPYPSHELSDQQAQPQGQPQRGQTPRDEEGRPTVISAETQRRLVPVSKVEERTGRKYTLDVVQQPRRARMCGFGDKDRRPITPPPCVRLIVMDPATGKEIDCNEIDHTMYVLNVDLWSEDAMKEVSLVRSSSPTPSISSTVPASYSSMTETNYAPLMPSNPGYPPQMPYGQPPPGYGYQVGQSPYQPSGYMPPAGASSYGPPQQYFPNHDPNFLASQGMYGRGYNDMSAMQHRGITPTPPSGMFTRNLIGSLACSAFRLCDQKDRIGVWFVVQDLSVRTEGHFRLRFSFVNVAPANPSEGMVHQGSVPVLASCFSDVFTVYSAKKFPGVWESTPLSKTFATQGIKIPIRKEGSNNKNNDDDAE
ncbi:hypothetical protein MKZ38_002226 [Zalerion maritima]|uniref:Velvet domain-containing protein n=1 Tax=Zalerion maritima TaxID=339359 RepID=A0AAD5RPY1_9PEZI|nr:hypothetical protein MKZ38_002226 [Zalerion maritima]